jgi:hypothetical protein
MPRGSRVGNRGRTRGMKPLAWDGPAGAVIAGAPLDLPLWVYVRDRPLPEMAVLLHRGEVAVAVAIRRRLAGLVVRPRTGGAPVHGACAFCGCPTVVSWDIGRTTARARTCGAAPYPED